MHENVEAVIASLDLEATVMRCVDAVVGAFVVPLVEFAFRRRSLTSCFGWGSHV
ncbi:hypothetical protein P4N68_01980 [Corynebacterium felinum]|uniref:Uncharacterized protein n=1 Tax=Corynebacterium felinum TaxID=131318 RepID=A0ABU2BBK1_9CORY|nr:hypothetical protein [Corynebacterium felinum]MDR7356007.1 hypothetical protein [Corynebacterium felinum]WJY95342.1 hypothetical protein CFELI_08685 [Corynebacterium felinum]